jgi:peptide/nickel transport system permease protein
VVLPIATLMLRPWATFTRLVLAGVDEAMSADWVRTARAKGLGEAYLLYRHVLPHALLPVISLVGIAASGALATGLVAEVIFAIPGVGRLLYDGVLERDIPLVQACLLVQVSLAVSANLAGNAAMRWANPALRV